MERSARANWSPVVIRARILAFAALCLFPAAAEAAEAASVLRGRGTEFCYGVTYARQTAAKQTLKELFVSKSFAADPTSEGKMFTAEERAEDDKGREYQHIEVARRQRNGAVRFHSLECGEDKGTYQCTAGSEEFAERNIDLKPDGDALIARVEGDRTRYRLTPRPMEECRAWQRRDRPAWTAKWAPLRVRYAERAPVCLTLAGKASRIAGLTLRVNKPVEIDPSPKIAHTMLRVTFTLRLADGTVRERNTRCDGIGHRLGCTYGYGVLYLEVAGERAVRVFERQARAGEKSELEAFFDVSLPKSERSFRLEEAELSACPAP